MPDFPTPDPKNVAALGDAVNEVFRGLALSPFHIPHSPKVRETGPSIRYDAVDEAFDQIESGVREGTIDDTGLAVKLSVTDAGALLTLAMVKMARHGRTDCRYELFTQCHYARSVVYYAAKCYTQILEAAAE